MTLFDDTVNELESVDWVTLVDRGGLIHVSDTMYMVFQSMELEFCQQFTVNTNETHKDVLLEKILTNEDLLSYWSMTSVNWVKEESTELLKMIAEQWITIRGFSSASEFVEMFKKQNKKTVEKSKGIRKCLISD